MQKALKLIVLLAASGLCIYISLKFFGIKEIIDSVDRDKRHLQDTHLPRFDVSVVKQPATIDFKVAGKTLVIDDPVVIREFLEMVHAGVEVQAHHSHPEGEISFTLSGMQDEYLLGHDSLHQNMFWLSLSVPGVKSVFEPTIYHFRSVTMSTWLTKLREKMANAKNPDAK